MKFQHSNSEFDALSKGYDGGIDSSLKKILGKDQDFFTKQKSYLLDKTLVGRSNLKLLDFGCGTGEFLNEITRNEKIIESLGVDVSEGMINEGKKRYGDQINIMKTEPSKLPFNEASFDVVTAICVFHHIPPLDWLININEIHRVLKKNGIFVLFEHNPLNPFTRIIVKNCPIDKNAVLLNPFSVSKLLERSNFSNAQVTHYMFFPPRFFRFWKFESILKRFPIGGQYQLISSKIDKIGKK